MKKIFLAIAAATMALGVSACKSDAGTSANTAGQTDPESTVAEMPVLAPMDTNALKKYDAQFFADSNKANYQTTASGLKYVTVTEGTGRTPAPTSAVNVHYQGRTTDGKIFDSSVQRGEPIAFPLNQVIPGWTEGLQLMKEGGTTVFYIPSNLAYGERGAGDAIAPNSDLIFEVQLLGIQ